MKKAPPVRFFDLWEVTSVGQVVGYRFDRESGGWIYYLEGSAGGWEFEEADLLSAVLPRVG